MTRTLVLGSSGLVGSAFKDAHGDDPDFLWPSRGDLDLGRELSEQRLPEEVQRIVYLAQGRNYRAFPERAEETLLVNVLSPVRLLAHYVPRGLSQFVYASSGNVPLFHRLTANSTRPDVDYYTATKLAAEQLIGSWGSLLAVAVVRLYTVYGPGAHPQSLVERLSSAMQAQSDIFLNGADGDLFQPTAVHDVAHALTEIVSSGWAGVANFGGPEQLTLREMVTRLGRALQREPRLASTGRSPSDYSVDSARLEDEIPSVQATISFPGTVSARESWRDNRVDVPKL